MNTETIPQEERVAFRVTRDGVSQGSGAVRIPDEGLSSLRADTAIRRLVRAGVIRPGDDWSLEGVNWTATGSLRNHEPKGIAA